MKKSFLLSLFIVLSSLLWAQTSWDFEDNSAGMWHGDGANTVTVIVNPVPTGNISNYVAQYISSTNWAWAMKSWNNNSLLNQDHVKLYVDVYFVDVNGTLKLQMDNPMTSGANFDGYKDVTANTWTTLEYDISGSALNYKQIAFQSSVAATIYLDNIRLVEGVSTDMVLATFETDLEGWDTWGAPLSQVTNPNTTENTSSGVALLNQTSGAWSGLAKWFGTPSILNPNKYIKMSVDVYYPTETARFQLYLGNSASSGAANHTDYTDAIPVGAWTTVEFSLTGLPANDYQQIAFQSGVQGPIYIDNIIMKVDETTPPPPPSFITPNAWINEIHYDKIAVETSEFIEVVIERPGNYSLSDFDIYFYNGVNGTAYRTANFANDFVAGDIDSVYQLFTYYTPDGQDWILNQNGGIALVFEGRVVQFISYDGTFAATDGPADGMTSTDIGVSQQDSPMNGYSLQLVGQGTRYSHFSWIDPPASPGSLNNTQLLAPPVVVPFNWSYLLFLFGALALGLVYRRIRQ